jgi:hypothetical protein
MKTRQLLAVLLLITNACWAGNACAAPELIDDGSDDLMVDAVQEYNAGHMENAVSLFMQELKKNPDSGRAHYYLGSALKKVGADANAIHELEMAIKFCPPGTIQTMAKQALHGDFQEEDQATSGPSAAPAQNSPPNFFSNLFSFFQPPNSPTTVNTASSNTRFEMPDIFHPFNDAFKGTKKWVREQARLTQTALEPKPQPGGAPSGPGTLQSDGTELIHMEEMLRIAEESLKANPKAQSHPTGVMRFEQAPENNADWSVWIRRFRNTFNNQLFRRMATEVKDETRGGASVIFSVDKQGHLRGCVYQTSADDGVTACLLETIRDLDRSYFLAFPSSSHISGWNFRMKWNFGRALAYIQYLRHRKAEALAAISKHDADLKTAALLKTKAEEAAEKAKAKKLAALAVPPRVVKTGVSAQIMQKPKPVELKAVPLKLSDMPPMTDQEINDLSIMKGDSSPLFR